MAPKPDTEPVGIQPNGPGDREAAKVINLGQMGRDDFVQISRERLGLRGGELDAADAAFCALRILCSRRERRRAERALLGSVWNSSSDLWVVCVATWA